MLALNSISAKIVFCAALCLFCMFLFFPIYWLVVTSLRPDDEILSTSINLVPMSVTFEHFVTVIATTETITFIVNSIYVSVATAILAVIISAPAAYAISVLRFAGSRSLMFGFLAGKMFPHAMLLITLYPLLRTTGLLNTRVGLAMVYLVQSLPVSVYLLFTTIRQIPREVVEAGRVDGAGELRILIFLIGPLLAPSLVAVALFGFIFAWNDLLFAVVLTTSDEARTIGPGLLLMFLGEYKQEWGGVMAASILSTLPILILFLALQRYYVQGLISGSVKS